MENLSQPSNKTLANETCNKSQELEKKAQRSFIIDSAKNQEAMACGKKNNCQGK